MKMEKMKRMYRKAANLTKYLLEDPAENLVNALLEKGTICGNGSQFDLFVTEQGEALELFGDVQLKADPKNEGMMSRLSELFCRINFLDDRGSFRLDFNDGSISYCVKFDCRQGFPVGQTLIESTRYATTQINMWISCIGKIIFTDTSAKEVWDENEKEFEAVIERLEKQLKKAEDRNNRFLKELEEDEEESNE